MFSFQRKTDRPLLLGAIHMPPFLSGTRQELRQLEAWLLRNVEAYAEGGFDSVMLQDNTPHCEGLDGKALACIAALGYSVTSRFSDYPIGLIIESNSARDALTIAAVTYMQYIRCKVFVGAMQKPGGLVEGSAHEAFHYRRLVDRDISVCADILDRMGAPLSERDYRLAVSQAKKYGADAVLLTGANFNETCRILDDIAVSAPGLPRLAGGGVNMENLLEAAAHCDGMVVSSCLTKNGCKDEWDRKKIAEMATKLRG